jgi:hypothetical protein
MNKEIESIKSFRSLLELYLQKDLQFVEKYKSSPEAYHIDSIKKILNEPQQMLNWIYMNFGVIMLPLFLLFINKSWLQWFQISYFLSYVFFILLCAFVFYWIRKRRKRKQAILINQIDASYKTLKLYFDNHPEILNLYHNRQLELQDAELVELYQEKVAKREKMIQQIDKILKNKK